MRRKCPLATQGLAQVIILRERAASLAEAEGTLAAAAEQKRARALGSGVEQIGQPGAAPASCPPQSGAEPSRQPLRMAGWRWAVIVQSPAPSGTLLMGTIPRRLGVLRPPRSDDQVSYR